MSPLPSRDSINRFFVLSGLWVTLHVSVFATQQAYSTLAVALWTLATTVSYAFLYLLPALLPGYLLHGFLARRAASRGGMVALAILLISKSTILPSRFTTRYIVFLHIFL